MPINLSLPFVVDSNFFIQAHRERYPLDVVTSFWDKVNALAKEGKIISIDKVRSEIFKREDQLKEWCAGCLDDGFFCQTNTAPIVSAYTRTARWATARSNHYRSDAITEFLDADEADAFLVSYAMAHGNTIVTHEKRDPARRNKIKIPDVCDSFNVSFVDTIGMLRAMGEKF